MPDVFIPGEQPMTFLDLSANEKESSRSDHSLRRFSFLLRRVNRLACLWRHVVLVMLGQHLIGVEDAVSSNMSLRYATASFLEQIGKNSLVDHGNALSRVSHDEARCQSIVIAIERSFFHQAT